MPTTAGLGWFSGVFLVVWLISCGRRERRRSGDVLRQLSKVLGGGGEEDFVASALEAAQPEAVELEDPFHVGEGHLDLLAVVAGALEGGRPGQGADLISHLFVDVARHPAVRCVGTAALFQDAILTVGLGGAIKPCSAIMHPTRGFEFLATWAEIEIAFLLIAKVGAGEGAVVALALVDHWNVRLDALFDQSLEGGGATVSGIGRQPFRLEGKAPGYPRHHVDGGLVLLDPVGPVALGIDDDASLVVDQIVGVIGEDRAPPPVGCPGRLRIGQGNGHALASSARRSDTLLIQVVQVVADNPRRPRPIGPGNGLIARHPLDLVDIGLDHAGIDREGFAADQPCRNASAHYPLEHEAQQTRFPEAFVPPRAGRCGCSKAPTLRAASSDPEASRACAPDDRQAPAHQDYSGRKTAPDHVPTDPSSNHPPENLSKKGITGSEHWQARVLQQNWVQNGQKGLESGRWRVRKNLAYQVPMKPWNRQKFWKAHRRP